MEVISTSLSTVGSLFYMHQILHHVFYEKNLNVQSNYSCQINIMESQYLPMKCSKEV